MKILHVPRTGGTAIKASLIPGYRRHPKDIRFLQTKINGVYICNHKQKLDNKDKYIIFVRDPIDRFVSHFIFLRNHAKGYDTENYMNPSADKVIFSYENINDFAKDIFRLNLKKFVKFLDILINPYNIRKCKENIFFVGRTEHLENDFIVMQSELKIEKYIYINKKYTNKRPDAYINMTKLDKKSLQNLREYLNRDYEIIRRLVSFNFLNDDYLKEIKYNI
jgi:hypothetical protein